jgi:thiol-disulfide isomerase/thioredoxin
MSKILKILIALVFIAFIAFKYVFNRTKTVGEKAPEITETLLSGEDFKLSDLQGNYVLIDFWGSWCPPCRKENKSLVPLYQKYENTKFKNGENFKIVSVAIEKKAERAEKAIAKDNLYWPHHIVQESKLVLKAPLALSYGITDLPTTLLLNPEGYIMGTNLPLEEVDKMLADRK